MHQLLITPISTSGSIGTPSLPLQKSSSTQLGFSLLLIRINMASQKNASIQILALVKCDQIHPTHPLVIKSTCPNNLLRERMKNVLSNGDNNFVGGSSWRLLCIFMTWSNRTSLGPDVVVWYVMQVMQEFLSINSISLFNYHFFIILHNTVFQTKQSNNNLTSGLLKPTWLY